ncbi:Protein CBR-MRPL-23 [Caenorhabditis briggsae]|uniref:Large ribosomal subunit protein uL23m n=3 Tax=Caenorhabditis briggsae TaxID=6238 RepID=RM23_CAEBR|nr:Protein CBR-MRPL-23 [Caenorhabditis briggsae]Q61DA8.1 RecName: Full=Large ribosomal subunit protein uL23m; AltName: Full=39S ribosomal protein L23, mitochondrial; Short=L23mt; Short=MRP-L23 [Caenorhabditis briggsae]ULU12679.1 hypothetical protein L3Y34_015731 [Caenorhabditis briggsae]CAP31524.1 Protein CBR-MRPL-23 [Caenorhabditis briggsae]
MTSRLARLWQPGNPQRRVFLPDFWMAVIESPSVGRNKLPRNCVKFEVDPRMSRHDIREYLTKIYDLPVRDVRTEVQMGDITWNTKLDHQYKKAMWKEEDKKIAYVFMSKDFAFSFPQMFAASEEVVELAKMTKQQEELKEKLNEQYANRNRRVGQFLAA